MTPLVAVAVLIAAGTHAGWNAMAHAIGDKLLAFTMMSGGGALCGLLLAWWAPLPTAAAWPFLLGSVAVHVAYVTLLMQSFRLGDFSQMYPIARGTAPLAVTVLAAVFAGERPGGWQICGVVLASCGLAWVALWGPRGKPRGGAAAGGPSPGAVGPAPETVVVAGRSATAVGVTAVVGDPGVGGPSPEGAPPGGAPPGAVAVPRRSATAIGVTAAVGTGLAIASYTVIDGMGVRASGSALGYIGWLLLLQGWQMPLYSLVRHRGGFVAWARPVVVRGMCGGLLSVLAYGLVLWAQTKGELAPISALRESSIIVGAVIGAVFFNESFGRPRLIGALLMVAGIGLMLHNG